MDTSDSCYPPVLTPWDKVIQTALEKPVRFPIATPPLGVQLMIEQNVLAYQAAVHWMIKLTWDSRYVIPVPRKLKDSTKSLGMWLKHIRLLCLECHDLALHSGMPIRYPTATAWFQDIVMQFYVGGTQQIPYKLYNVQDFSQWDKEYNLRREVRILNEICSRAKALEPPKQECQEYAFGVLLTIAIQMAERLSVFKQERFNPFIKAWRESITEIEQRWHSFDLQDDGKILIVQLGKGRHKRNLSIEGAKRVDR